MGLVESQFLVRRAIIVVVCFNVCAFACTIDFCYVPFNFSDIYTDLNSSSVLRLDYEPDHCRLLRPHRTPRISRLGRTLFCLVVLVPSYYINDLLYDVHCFVSFFVRQLLLVCSLTCIHSAYLYCLPMSRPH